MDIENERERASDYYRSRTESAGKVGNILIKAKNATRKEDNSLHLSDDVIVTTSYPIVLVQAGKIVDILDEQTLEGDLQININSNVLTTNKATITKNGDTVIRAEQAVFFTVVEKY